MRLVRLGAALVLSGAGAVVAAQQPPPPAAKPDTAEVKTMIDRLRAAAGPRWQDAVHFWCEAPRANRPDDPAIPPTRIFDNVFAIGNSGTTVYVIRTSSGLLMIDALGGNDGPSTTAQVESQLLPGFERLGLDPAQVKVILVTHGHADHFGGSSYFQEKYGAKVYVAAADWNLMENPPARGRGGRGPAGAPTPVPRRDMEMRDGETITLGDFSVNTVAVPGHTPGSVGFVFPVKDRGRAHVAALFGGAWLTPQILSDEALQTFRMSVQHFKEATGRAKVDVLLQNHMLMDPIQDKLDKLTARKPRDPNPFVVGAAQYQKFLDVMDGCTRVNITRRQA